jgi:hypothetical protein
MHDSGEEAVAGPEDGVPLKRISAALSLTLMLPLGGDVGGGAGAPSYSDAFGVGLGAGISGGYRILPAVDGRVGFGFSQFTSSPFDLSTTSGVQTNELSDYFTARLTLGPRFFFLIDRPVDRWFDIESKQGLKGLYPFAGFNLGITFTGAVEWPTPPPKWDYWDSGITSFFDVYAGAEYRVLDNFGAFAEAGLAIFGPPNPASLGPYAGMNEAGSLTALRISIGVLLAI